MDNDYKKYTQRLDQAQNNEALKRLAWQILCGYAEENQWEFALTSSGLYDLVLPS